MILHWRQFYKFCGWRLPTVHNYRQLQCHRHSNRGKFQCCWFEIWFVIHNLL